MFILMYECERHVPIIRRIVFVFVDEYDVVVVGGGFAPNHIPVAAIPELFRIMKKGTCQMISTLPTYMGKFYLVKVFSSTSPYNAT
jgi:hypothetical protein